MPEAGPPAAGRRVPNPDWLPRNVTGVNVWLVCCAEIESDVSQLEERNFRNDHVQLDLPNFFDRQEIYNSVDFSFVAPSVRIRD